MFRFTPPRDFCQPQIRQYLTVLALVAQREAPTLELVIAARRKKFLIVENDANDAFFIERALVARPEGHSVFICRSGGEAKSYLSGAGIYANRSKYPLPDLVITDLRMITDSGTELVEWMRAQQSALCDIAVVILTGSATAAEFAEAEQAGARAVFEKPSNFEDMRALLAAIACDYG